MRAAVLLHMTRGGTLQEKRTTMKKKAVIGSHFGSGKKVEEVRRERAKKVERMKMKEMGKSVVMQRRVTKAVTKEEEEEERRKLTVIEH